MGFADIYRKYNAAMNNNHEAETKRADDAIVAAKRIKKQTEIKDADQKLKIKKIELSDIK